VPSSMFVSKPLQNP